MEEAKGGNQYNSIIVPSVQEMVKETTIKTVPQRYIRSDLDKTEITDESGPRTEIPVIDLNRLCSSTSMASSEIDKLDSACKEWGFFQLVNHGMDSEFLDKVKSEIQDLFNLPMEQKKKLWQQPGEIEGFGQAFVVSEEQKLDWSDMFYLTMQPVRSRKPHLFSKLPLPFRGTLETYSTEVKSIAKILLANMARALKIKPEEILEELFDDELSQKMRMNYYPPCPDPDQVIGLTPHSDATGLTILLQANEVEGLQIKKDGKWVPVKPLPNAFVVNIGDVLEIITNGTYKSIEHRGVVNSEKERLSVAAFHNIGMGKVVGPLRSLVERQKGALFRSVTIEEFLKVFFSRELDGKAFLDVWRI
ncbi:2-oxoglutarate [Hirschfeldia incana]|nr:2-oxoglutarate [Hirschfeldia incana]